MRVNLNQKNAPGVWCFSLHKLYLLNKAKQRRWARDRLLPFFWFVFTTCCEAVPTVLLMRISPSCASPPLKLGVTWCSVINSEHLQYLWNPFWRPAWYLLSTFTIVPFFPFWPSSVPYLSLFFHVVPTARNVNIFFNKQTNSPSLQGSGKTYGMGRGLFCPVLFCIPSNW